MLVMELMGYKGGMKLNGKDFIADVRDLINTSREAIKSFQFLAGLQYRAFWGKRR